MSIPKGNKANFETLKKVITNGDAALMECVDKKTGETVDVICAVNRRSHDGYEMVPLALMYREVIYDRLLPPGEKKT